MSALELKIPPVVVTALTAFAMWAIGELSAFASSDFTGRIPLAVALAASGVAVTGAGLKAFRRARTTVNPMQPGEASTLVASGVYRVTRNPMYLGFLLLLLAWAVFLANPATLIAIVVFVLYMNRFQITPEERALAGLFGKEFEEYRRRVRRWL